MGDACIYLRNGKSADLSYLLNNPRVVIFDFARCESEHINYGIVEQVKDGYVVSTKYEPMVKKFEKPWVVVFANMLPGAGKFSEDRLELIEI